MITARSWTTYPLEGLAARAVQTTTSVPVGAAIPEASSTRSSFVTDDGGRA